MRGLFDPPEDPPEDPPDRFGPVYPDGLPGHKGSDTSLGAAVALLPTLAEKQAEVLEVLRAAGDDGLTGHELAERTGMQVHAISGRTAELVLLGLIEDSGQRRLSPYRRWVIVWVAIKKGNA